MGAPTTSQLALLVIALALFAVGGIVALIRLRRDQPILLHITRLCLYAGAAASLGLLVWHSADRGDWRPLGDNFDAMVWLATLLSLFVIYTQRRRPVRGLEWFVMPIVILLLAGAAHFGMAGHYREYRYPSIWLWVHSAAAYGGAVAFAVAAACGWMYLVAANRLRRKLSAKTVFGNLERLDHLTMTSVTLGFALLTVGLVTGIVYWLDRNDPPSRLKVWLSAMAWLVYAVVLHAPINPRFRGRRVAILSIFGFVLMIGTLVAVALFSGGRA